MINFGQRKTRGGIYLLDLPTLTCVSDRGGGVVVNAFGKLHLHETFITTWITQYTISCSFDSLTFVSRKVMEAGYHLRYLSQWIMHSNKNLTSNKSNMTHLTDTQPCTRRGSNSRLWVCMCCVVVPGVMMMSVSGPAPPRYKTNTSMQQPGRGAWSLEPQGGRDGEEEEEEGE